MEPYKFIRGQTIDLVPSSTEFANYYCKWKNEPKVRQFLRGPMPVILEMQKKRLETRNQGKIREFVIFTIWHKKDNKPIGEVGLSRINWVNRWANAFAYIGETHYWNKQIASEATKLLLNYAFKELNLNKVSGTVAVDNIGSWKVAEKLGFLFEGILKDEFYHNGTYISVKKYGFFKNDWLKKNE